MLLPYIARSKDRHKRRRRGSLLHIRPSVRLFALHQAHHASDFESKFSGGFDRLNGRRSRGANIIHDHHSRRLAAEALDPLPRSMLLFSLAHQKTIQSPASHRDGYHDRIGSHSQPPNCLRVPASSLDFFQKNLPRELRSTRIKRGGPAIDVVVTPPSG